MISIIRPPYTQVKPNIIQFPLVLEVHLRQKLLAGDVERYKCHTPKLLIGGGFGKSVTCYFLKIFVARSISSGQKTNRYFFS